MGGGGRRCQDCTQQCAQLTTRQGFQVLTGVGMGVEVATGVLAKPVVGGRVEVAGGHVASHLRTFSL